MYFKFLVQGTPRYPVSCRTLSFSQFLPSMPIILTHPVLLSISNAHGASLCLLRVWPLTACLSVELNMRPNRQFRRLFVVHSLLCLHVLRRVTRPLCSLCGGGCLVRSLPALPARALLDVHALTNHAADVDSGDDDVALSGNAAHAVRSFGCRHLPRAL